MIVSPIIPIWLMTPICIAFIVIIIKNKSRKINLITRLLITILLFVINLRIMIPTSNVEIMANNLDVLFVIDNTISMVAEDYKNNTPRLSAVKNDCKHIMNELSGAKFSVITFGDSSQIITPYTKDNNMTVEAIETIKIADPTYAKGSTLNVVLDDMKKVLSSSATKENRMAVVFFISDGEITSDEKLKSFGELKKYVKNGAVLGYGTSKGGQMKVKYSYKDSAEYLEDRSTDEYPYPKAISKIDENNLKKIASDIGIDYINMSKQSNIDKKLKEIKKEVQNKISDEDKKTSFEDIYYIFVIPLLLLVIYELINYKKKL